MRPAGCTAVIFASIAAACGPSGGIDGGAASDGTGATAPTTESGSSGATTVATDTGDPAVTTTPASETTDPVDTTGAESSSTGGEEVCVDGIFAGVYTSGFESSALEICDGPSGGVWADVSGVYPCNEVWIVVEGTLCGPGQYGHLGGYDYSLNGTLVEGPCAVGSCGERPSGCGRSAEVCGLIEECDLVAQDCVDGEKCVPSSPSGGPPWAGTHCVPAPRVGEGVGDPCFTAELDTCEPGLFCWNEDPTAPDGACVELCALGMATCKTGECVACIGEVLFGMCLPGMCGAGPCTC